MPGLRVWRAAPRGKSKRMHGETWRSPCWAGDRGVAITPRPCLRSLAVPGERVELVVAGVARDAEMRVAGTPVDGAVGDRRAAVHRRAGREAPQRAAGRTVECEHR